MAFNKWDRPATMRTRGTRNIALPNPLDGMEYTGNVSVDARNELAMVLEVFRACDQGEYAGPFAINSPHHFIICFESYEQKEAFRKAVGLTHHEEQYWDGAAFLGSLNIIKAGKTGSVFAKRENPFSARAAAPKQTANAEKYSKLRAETRRTAEKLQAYTEDRTWIAVCFPTPEERERARKHLGFPDGKFIHVDDALTALANSGIILDVPHVSFGLRAVAKPDKALLALVES